MNFLKYIRAEFIKLNYSPIIWLIGFVLMAICSIIFAAHFLDAASVAGLGVNPWDRAYFSAIGILSVFMLIPFVVLLVSAAIFIEHQSNTWKFQYSIPVTRTTVFLSKMTSILLLVFGVAIFLFLLIIPLGYLLNFFMPEMEFNFYSMEFSKRIGLVFHAILSVLGVFGIQYFLSYRFKGFLVPATFGVLSFVVGILLGSVNKSLSLYFPYSYPAIYRDHRMFTIDKIGIKDYGLINSVELHSIICFLFFIALTVILERRKNIT